MAPIGKPLLDLSTIVDRPKIKVDGELYDLARPSDLGFKQDAQLSHAHKRANELHQKENGEAMTDDDWEELSHLLDRSCRILILDLPNEKHELLSDIQRLQVMTAFTQATRTANEAIESPKTKPKTSEKK